MEVHRAIVKRNSEFKTSIKHSKVFPGFKMARKMVNRLVANKKFQYYNNKVLRTILTKGHLLRNINERTGKQVESKQISL